MEATDLPAANDTNLEPIGSAGSGGSSAVKITRNPHPTSPARRAEILRKPGFGKSFTDHMVVSEWRINDGWAPIEIIPYGPLTVDPATAVLHYAQEIFEGMKAYRHADGSVWTFRPEINAGRFQKSSRRLALPELPVETFLDSLAALVATDKDWVPSGEVDEFSLYLRPFMFASEAFLGVRPAHQVRYCVIASPAGPYFAGGVKPVSIWLSESYSRAGRGGTGAAKCGGNYASSLIAQQEGAEHGCAQVVFLDSSEHTYVEELGGMNVVLVYADGTLVTPELNDSILDGVTRNAIIELAHDQGHKIDERRVPVDEWREGVVRGDIVEVFACGTAAVITPIGELKWRGGSVRSGTEAGPITRRLREALLDIQYGRVADTHGWMHRLA
jgi:branched-chain amino acid aminotransferase